MLKKIKSAIINYIKQKIDEIEDVEHLIPEQIDNNIEIPQSILDTYDSTKKNIIIIDDSIGIVSIVEDFISNCDIDLSEYNVLKFYGKYAPFVLIKTLSDLNIKKIDFAIIDIVLPGKMKLNNEYIRLDGIDVSIILNKDYACTNFAFFTGNIVSEYIDYIKEKVTKFNEHFNKDITKFIIFKGDNDGKVTITKLNKLFKRKAYKI